MKYQIRDWVKDSAGLVFLDIFLQFLPGFMLYHCAAAAVGFFSGREDILFLFDGMWLLVLTAGFYLFRYCISDFRLFLLGHMVWLVIFCMILPQTVVAEGVLLAVGIFRYFASSAKKAGRVNFHGEKINCNKVDLEATEPWEGCVVLFSLVLALVAQDIRVIYPFLVESIFFYLAYFLRTHLSGRRLYLEQYEHMNAFPMKQMKRTGGLVMTIYLLISAICLCCGAYYRKLFSDTGPFIWLWGKIMQVIRWIGFWLRKLEIFFHWDDSTAENTNAMDLSDFLRMERGETSPILKALEKVLEVGLSFLLIVLLVWGLVCLLLRFGQRYQNGKRITRSTEECEEIRENLKQKDAGGNERRIRHIFRTSEQKIRFIYVRAVKRAALNLQIRGIEPGTDVDGRKYGENSWKRVVHFYRFLSPHELNCAISMEKQVEDEDGLRCLYEQARYGEKPVTRQMVAQAKKAAGQVNRTEIQRHNRNIET